MRHEMVGMQIQSKKGSNRFFKTFLDSNPIFNQIATNILTFILAVNLNRKSINWITINITIKRRRIILQLLINSILLFLVGQEWFLPLLSYWLDLQILTQLRLICDQ